MSPIPVLLIAFPLIVAVLVLALYPWRSKAMSYGGPSVVLLLVAVVSPGVDTFGQWVFLLGLPVVVALIGLGNAWSRFPLSR